MPQLFYAALGGFTDNIWLNMLFVLIGIVLVLWGADRLTEGAVGLAERMKVSQLVIGLTVVAMGTSMPEFCVSLVSALKGTPDLTVRKDIPFAVLASGALFLLCLDGNIGRVDAGFLLILFVFFMGITLTTAKPDGEVQSETKKPMKPLVATAWLLVGLACLVFGSNLFVDGATTVAQAIGISDAVIGLTIVAGGTSLPELATSAVAARKGNSGIAIGNVLGSNVFNILLILGVTGVISPMNIQGIGLVDLSVLLGSMMLLWLFSFTKYTITRLEGALLSSIYIIYVGYLIVQVVK